MLNSSFLSFHCFNSLALLEHMKTELHLHSTLFQVCAINFSKTKSSDHSLEVRGSTYRFVGDK